MSGYGDLNDHYRGKIYDLTVTLEIYNLRKDHDKVRSKNPRAKYVDSPTAIGTTWLIARTKDCGLLNSEPRYLAAAARRVRNKIKGDELIVITKVKENETKL